MSISDLTDLPERLIIDKFLSYYGDTRKETRAYDRVCYSQSLPRELLGSTLILESEIYYRLILKSRTIIWRLQKFILVM